MTGVLVCSPAFPSNISWNGGPNSWSNAASWSLNKVPNNSGSNTYDVTIASGGPGGDQVDLDLSPTISSLTLGIASTQSQLYDYTYQTGDSLTVTGPVTVGNNGSLFLFSTINAGSFANSGLVDVSGTMNITNGNLVNANSLDVDSGSTLTVHGTLANQSGGTFQDYGITNATALTNSGHLFINVNATLNLTNGITDVPAGSVLDIAGKVNSSAFAGLTSVEGSLALGIAQTITITPKGGTLTVSGSFGGGNINVDGNLALEPGASVDLAGFSTLASGITDIPQGATLRADGFINSGGTSALSRLTTIEGNLYLEDQRATTITPNGGTLTNSGTFTVDTPSTSVMVAGNLTNANSLNVFYSTLQALKFNSAGTSIVGGATFAVGSGTLPAGTTGYYQFANGAVGEMIFGSPTKGDTCSGSDDCGIINVTGPVRLSGTLDALLENGFDPINGESFIFLTFTPGELSGTFSNLGDKYFNNDTQQWELTYNNTAGFVELTTEPYTPPAAVPEPASMLLFGAGFAGLGFLVRRRSRRKPREAFRH